MSFYDVVIVGGGPGGLSAALLLGRGRATTLLVDGDTPRNARAEHVHTFVTRDGTPPRDFRAIARDQLKPYPTVEVRDAKVTSVERLAEPDADHAVFVIGLAEERVRARRVLLATGVRDQLPEISGLPELWGSSVFQCPYCHGWELRDRPWGVLVDSDAMASFAPFVSNWASRVTAFTNGTQLSDETLQTLRGSVVDLETEPIQRLAGASEIEAVELASGRVVRCAALVVRPRQLQVALVRALGLALDDQGFVRVDSRTKESSVPGLHVIGDATTMMQAAMIAAADGFAAAAIINHATVMERLEQRRSS